MDRDKWQAIKHPLKTRKSLRPSSKWGPSRPLEWMGFNRSSFNIESVFASTRNFFMMAKLPEGLNETLIVLIPKTAKPETLTQFRPISLCNVLYKTITKFMVNRIRPIVEALGSFLPGRYITDNIIITQEQEIVHSMQKKRGKTTWMLLKIDLEKEYDHLRLEFVENTLVEPEFSGRWVAWIRECVASSSMRVLWNGKLSETFIPSRGIRKGDPISPYIHPLHGAVKPNDLSSCGPKEVEADKSEQMITTICRIITIMQVSKPT
ncbi:hypothetical protein V2J09_009650 [Rumex salicifolius]